MNTRNTSSEEISVFADGEATDAEIDAALAALGTDEGRAQWALMHQIGDSIRSDELAGDVRPDFLPGLFARLEQEPTIMAPAASARAADGGGAMSANAASQQAPNRGRRFAVPGLAAAAVAAFAVLGGSQLLVAQHEPAAAPTEAKTMLASAHSAMEQGRRAASADVELVAAGNGELLRDPNIDQYLLAHQRFSPSLYSTAQYARSPVSANESDK